MGCCGAWLQTAFGEREELWEGGDLSYRRSPRCPTSRALCWRLFCAVQHYPASTLCISRRCHLSCLAHDKTLRPSSAEGQSLAPSLQRAKSICYLSNIAGCLCLTWGLHPIWHSKWKVPLQGSFCLLCSPTAQEKQSPAVFPRSRPWWVLCCGHGQEPERGKFAGWILSLSCDLISIFTPSQKSFKKLHLFFFALSSSNLTRYENLQTLVTFIVQILMSLILYVWSICLYCFPSKILNFSMLKEFSIFWGTEGSWAHALLCLRPQQPRCFSVFPKKVWYN